MDVSNHIEEHSMLKEKIEKYLLSVQKPARYIGGEAGSI